MRISSSSRLNTKSLPHLGEHFRPFFRRWIHIEVDDGWILGFVIHERLLKSRGSNTGLGSRTPPSSGFIKEVMAHKDNEFQRVSNVVIKHPKTMR